jgi:hypothetical protein
MSQEKSLQITQEALPPSREPHRPRMSLWDAAGDAVGVGMAPVAILDLAAMLTPPRPAVTQRQPSVSP